MWHDEFDWEYLSLFDLKVIHDVIWDLVLLSVVDVYVVMFNT